MLLNPDICLILILKGFLSFIDVVISSSPVGPIVRVSSSVFWGEADLDCKIWV